MAKKIEAGVVCRVIGGNSGPKSPNIGRIVVVLGAHPNPVPHTVWGQIWHCQAKDGKPFAILRDNAEEYGGGHAFSLTADLAEDWLEPLEDDMLPPMALEREKEISDH